MLPLGSLIHANGSWVGIDSSCVYHFSPWLVLVFLQYNQVDILFFSAQELAKAFDIQLPKFLSHSTLKRILAFCRHYHCNRLIAASLWPGH
jgi:hypothetical protein